MNMRGPSGDAHEICNKPLACPSVVTRQKHVMYVRARTYQSDTVVQICVCWMCITLCRTSDNISYTRYTRAPDGVRRHYLIAVCAVAGINMSCKGFILMWIGTCAAHMLCEANVLASTRPRCVRSARIWVTTYCASNITARMNNVATHAQIATKYPAQCTAPPATAKAH